MKKAIARIVLLMFFMIHVPPIYADHSPTHSRWSIEIIEDDLVIENLYVSERGYVTIPILIVNENQISITVSLNYSSPFDSTISGPESVTIGGSSNFELEVVLSEIDILEYRGGENDDFEVTGTVTSRQGLPISVPGDSDSTNVKINIPEIQSLDIYIENTEMSINSGEEITIRSTLKNTGNVEVSASEIILISDCPMLKIVEQATNLILKDIMPNEEISANNVFQSSEEQTTKTCNVKITAIYTDSINEKRSEDNAAIFIQYIEETKTPVVKVTDNIPAPNILISIIAILFAALKNKPYSAINRTVD